MRKAFVFGKFLPFHKGHEALIRFALTRCDFLTVLICCSNRESVPANVRKGWMEQTFGDIPQLEFRILDYREEELPNTSVSSEEVSLIWSRKFLELFPGYECVITSEKYGDYIAAFMQIKHIPFDIPRKQVSVSATQIRSAPYREWDFIPASVKPQYCSKVVILGTESTGKTTLTQQLAQALDGAFVLEAGRDLIPDSNEFTEADLQEVAWEHTRRIRLAQDAGKALLLIDTDIHITRSYARFALNLELAVPDEVVDANRAQLYLYLNNDVPFVQDGTRLTETERNLLDASHRQILAEEGIPYVEISGNWEERFQQALEAIRERFNAPVHTVLWK